MNPATGERRVVDRRALLARSAAAAMVATSAGLARAAELTARANPAASDAAVFFDVTSGVSDDRPPLLLITPDGAAPFVGRVAGMARLEPAALDALLAFLFDEQRVHEIDAAAIEAEMKALATDGRVIALMDAGTTHVSARRGEQAASVSFYGVRVYARSFPEIDALTRLAAIETRLWAEIEALSG